VTWITISILSAFFSAARYLYVKKFCASTPAESLVFSTRVLGAVFLLPGFLAGTRTISDIPRFCGVLAVTVVLTMAATLINIRMVQRHAITRSVPYMSFIPIFMVPWTWLLYGQVPSPAAFAGILLTCGGAYALNLRPGGNPWQPLRALASDRVSLLMLVSSMLIGCTTAFDLTAIRVSSGATYAFVWTAVSALSIGAAMPFLHPARIVMRSVVSTHTIVQAALWAVCFYCQMAAVQTVITVPSGVTYVKTLTMVYIVFTVAAGGALFRETGRRRSVAAAAVMVAGAMIVALYR